jgi:4-diphosphocytidyl-2-C-methyl-D-erythritol kinase
MIDFPNAKINIGLFVTGKRSDGYHNLETVFFPVKLYDALEFAEAGSFSFSSSGIAIPGNPIDNIVTKAYYLLRSEFNLPEISIHLHKKIPFGAGLGGGSADGAFMLKMLNSFFRLGLDNTKLKLYARNLGADCPFFIENKPAFATGTGENLSPVDPDLSDYSIVIVKPSFSISTREAYEGIIPLQPACHLPEIMKESPENWGNFVRNDFEKHLFIKYPELKQIKSIMSEYGAAYASMTGSGSAVYGIFRILPVGINEAFPHSCLVYR